MTRDSSDHVQALLKNIPISFVTSKITKQKQPSDHHTRLGRMSHQSINQSVLLGLYCIGCMKTAKLTKIIYKNIL